MSMLMIPFQQFSQTLNVLRGTSEMFRTFNQLNVVANNLWVVNNNSSLCTVKKQH